MVGKVFAPGEVLAASDVNAFLANYGYQFRQTVYFTTSATFSKADYPWLRAIKVRCQGAGGGGGGAASNGAGGASAGSGGGGGGYAESFITDIAGLASSVTVTRGAGGAGGVGSGNGGAGGNTSFGALVVGEGGGSGVGVTSATGPASVVQRGGGGQGGTGDVVFVGNGGLSSLYGISGTLNYGGHGGTSHLGGGGRGPASNTGANASDGELYGGGGGGAHSRVGTAFNGGAGANGIVIVELYA
jgi:hypothetical protein